MPHRAASCAAKVVLPSPPMALVTSTHRPRSALLLVAADGESQMIEPLNEPIDLVVNPWSIQLAGWPAGWQRRQGKDLGLDPARQHVGVRHPLGLDFQQQEEPQHGEEDDHRQYQPCILAAYYCKAPSASGPELVSSMLIAALSCREFQLLQLAVDLVMHVLQSGQLIPCERGFDGIGLRELHCLVVLLDQLGELGSS